MATTVLKYSTAVSTVHWTMGTGILGCFATVQAAQYTKPKETTLGLNKGEWMNLHKSIALIVAAMVPARLALRATTIVPGPVSSNTLEYWGSKVSHLAMYGFITVMPTTGIVMGYYGGRGLPFFGYTIPGGEKDTVLAGQAFKIHKQAGLFFEYFTLLHVGAVGYHLLKGDVILARMGIGAFPK